MRKNENTGRDSLSWAGSRRGDKDANPGLPRNASSEDLYKLHKIRHKLDDSTYVDSAVTRIANFLTSSLRKDSDER